MWIFYLSSDFWEYLRMTIDHEWQGPIAYYKGITDLTGCDDFSEVGMLDEFHLSATDIHDCLADFKVREMPLEWLRCQEVDMKVMSKAALNKSVWRGVWLKSLILLTPSRRIGWDINLNYRNLWDVLLKTSS